MFCLSSLRKPYYSLDKVSGVISFYFIFIKCSLCSYHKRNIIKIPFTCLSKPFLHTKSTFSSLVSFYNKGCRFIFFLLNILLIINNQNPTIIHKQVKTTICFSILEIKIYLLILFHVMSRRGYLNVVTITV